MTEDWKFKASTKDIYDIDFQGCIYDVYKRDGSVQPLIDVPDTVINTSCEHITDFKKWWDSIPKGTMVILQNNDFVDNDDETVVNTITDMQSWLDELKLSKRDILWRT